MNGFMGVWFVAIGLFIVGMVGVNVYAATKTGEATITVVSKERGTDEKPALVFTEGQGTFAVEDSLLEGHFSSSDTYGALREGKTYTCKTRGIRFPILSKWPNLVECQAV